MKIVIIEDENLTARDLINTIKSLEPNAEIIQHLSTVEDAISFFSTKPEIDLIFSDIELGDGHSFEIYEQVNITTPIIFCTAFNEFALKAFDTSGIDYILKPFSKEAVKKSLEKFKQITKQNGPVSADYKSMFESIAKQIQPTKLPNIIIHQGDKIIPMPGDSIAIFYIDNTIVKALDFEAKQMVLSYNLEELEQKFSPTFYRANRQFLINRAAVKEASQHFNRKLLVHLNITFTEQILIGKEKTTSFLEWLANF
jgi:two-component system, LytTR family, response regulator LytT